MDDLSVRATNTLSQRSSRRAFLRLSSMTALGFGLALTRSRVSLATATGCVGCGGCPGTMCVPGNPNPCNNVGYTCGTCQQGGGCNAACTGGCWYCCVSNCRIRCCECTCPNGVCCHCFTQVAQFCSSGAAAPLACACP